MIEETSYTYCDRSVFRDFQVTIAAARVEMEQLLTRCKQNPLNLADGRNDLSDLLNVLIRFKALRQSNFGWQDIHGMDDELVERAERVLELFGNGRLF